MFGSKLRSWMENHIVRPRKKGNKNKNNGTSGNLAPSNTSNGHKGTSFQGDSSTISSPARRSEVSPIQNHKTSRAGWQSPQDNALSPKSDDYPYRHTVKSTSSPKKMLHKSSYTLEKNNGCNSTIHLHPNYQQYSKTVDQKQFAKTTDQHKYHRANNDSCDITRQSTINHYCQNNYSHHNLTAPNYPISSSSTTSNEMLEQKPTQYERICLMDQSQQIVSNNAAGKQIMENQFSKKNSSVRINNGADTMAKLNKYEQDVMQSTRNRDEYQPDTISDGKVYIKQMNENSENRYGKIQSRKLSTSLNSGETHLQTPSSVCVSNYDRCNANIQLNGGMKRCDNNSKGVMNCVNNNYDSSQQLHHYNHHNGNNNNLSDNLPVQHSFINDGSVFAGNKVHLKQQVINSTMHSNIRRSETNRNMLRTNRYTNGSHLSAPGTHQLAHMINSLSSPESAYSTGYSTDGTSPGGTYTPEYYINMRTGTHYFPRGVSSVVAVEQSRHKFGLNKIDEAAGSETTTNSHRRTESCDLGRRSVNNGNGGMNVDMMGNSHALTAKTNLHSVIVSTGLSPDLQRRLALQNYKGMESPSPRQRCRIRTNPWLTNPWMDPTCIVPNCINPKKIEMDTSSTSSGIKSSSDAGADEKNGKKILSSESESSSSTEIDLSKKLFTPTTIRRKRELVRNEPRSEKSVNTNPFNQAGDSDEDATLNEMMGKFDESYCYEKETDILSDSDPTECMSDLDTGGQDGGDECDTDELLDIDFIDNGSIQEIIDKNLYENTGSCTYFNFQQSEKRLSRTRKSHKQTEESTAGSGKRRKRLTRTRKRSSDCRDISCNSRLTDELSSPMSCGRVRGSKSLNGTPVSLRRNKSGDSKCSQKMTPLANRCNSLTFTEIHSIRSRFLAIAESEKALIKADLEADVKYRQLIHEAETILVSMKTTTSSAVSRETPVPSPRRIPTVPTNKRVEMLRNCEADLRRELAKAQKINETSEMNRKIINTDSSCSDAPLTVHQDNLLLNKRIELLRFETTSAPNSPKSGRFSPRKTHVSNFIYQNASPTDLMRRKSSPESTKLEQESIASSKLSPQLQLNGRKMMSPPKSPTPRRRFRSQSPRVTIESDSDSDAESKIGQKGFRKSFEVNGNKENIKRKNVRKIKTKIENDDLKPLNIDELDILNKNLDINNLNGFVGDVKSKASMMSFRSIDMGNKIPEIFYCPQSEPLKRKIYSGSKTLEKLQQTLDMDPEISKKALLHKISLLRRERKAAQMDEMNGHHQPILEPINGENGENGAFIKRQLILNTIEDLKRSLEDQSVELCGLNDDEE